MQYNYNIELNTYKDIIDFVKIIGTLPPKEKILVTSGDLSGNARSLLNMMAIQIQINPGLYHMVMILIKTVGKIWMKRSWRKENPFLTGI